LRARKIHKVHPGDKKDVRRKFEFRIPRARLRKPFRRPASVFRPRRRGDNNRNSDRPRSGLPFPASFSKKMRDSPSSGKRWKQKCLCKRCPKASLQPSRLGRIGFLLHGKPPPPGAVVGGHPAVPRPTSTLFYRRAYLLLMRVSSRCAYSISLICSDVQICGRMRTSILPGSTSALLGLPASSRNRS
jgi:hypothetical protein